MSFPVASGMESLASCLATFRRTLGEDKDMEITNDEANAMVQRVAGTIGVGTNQPTGVALVPVHTYVHQLDKSPTAWGSSSIVVPPFACHWGIIVGKPERPRSQMLYHLILAPGAGDEVRSSQVENKHIQFHVTSLSAPLENMKYVGQTQYNTDQLAELGRAMIDEFGNYHRVFWNCQTFAKCYLRVITGDKDADFESWTSADTSRLFLCAFLVGSPFATSNKVKEKLETGRLVGKIMSIPEHLSAKDRSAQAISAMYEALKQDRSWGREVGLVEDGGDRAGLVDRLLKLLFRKE